MGRRGKTIREGASWGQQPRDERVQCGDTTNQGGGFVARLGNVNLFYDERRVVLDPMHEIRTAEAAFAQHFLLDVALHTTHRGPSTKLTPAGHKDGTALDGELGPAGRAAAAPP